MKSNRAILLTLMTIIGALLVSVVSYAQTAPASASNVITTIGISGGSGRPIPQEIPGSADLISVALSGSTTLTVNNTLGFISGDYVRIDDGTVHGYHTVASVTEDSITITPPLATSFAAGGTTSIEEQAVYDRTPTWNPIIGSTTSVKPGNYFFVNATGLSTSSATVVDILLTNGDQLTRNYGHLNRKLNVYVTKGDANTNIDPVPVSPDRVGGIVVYDIPQVGHLFLFLNSPQGRIFALIMGISVVGYILYIAVSDNWRNVVVAAQTGAGTLSPEAAEQALGLQEQTGADPIVGATAGGPSEVQSGVPPGPAPGVAAGQTMASADLRLVAGISDERLEDIETGIHETRDSLQHFTAAIADYGTHLQSHTATVQAMSTASQSLVQAVDRQNVVLERLETTLDRDPAGGILGSTQRRDAGRSGMNAPAGTQTGSPAQRRAAGRITDIVGSIDGRPTLNAADGMTRRRISGRRATTGGTDFRRALRKVSAKRPSRPRRAG
jgi:hypothetical protein